MTTILHIDASVQPDPERSLSKRLSRTFVDAWLERAPDTTVIPRDVGAHPPPLICGEWVAAAFAPVEQRTQKQLDELALSDVLIDEIARADVIAMGTPMYNYGMPGPLKSWFDKVIRINKTFTFDLARGDVPLEPVMHGKTLVILSSHGEYGFEPGGPNESKNHLETHIRTCAHYLGVDKVHVIGIDYQEFGGARHEASVRDAFSAVFELVDTLVVGADIEASAENRRRGNRHASA